MPEARGGCVSAAEVVRVLRARGLWIAVAESCTGGALASALTDVEGASEVLAEARVVYSGAAKRALGLPPERTEGEAVYSAETAVALARAIVRIAPRADVGVGITGRLSFPDARGENGVWTAVRLGALDRAEYVEIDASVRDRPSAKRVVVERALRTLGTMLCRLEGRRVWLTGSEAIAEEGARAVRAFGGVPVGSPLIRAVPRPDSLPEVSGFDRIVVTSPSAARIFSEGLARTGSEKAIGAMRFVSCGPGTSSALERAGATNVEGPETGFGAAGLVEWAKGRARPGERWLRVRSDRAGTALAEALRACGPEVEDRVLYDTVPTRPDDWPGFDDVLFASASAVEAFFEGGGTTDGKRTVVIGRPTAEALRRWGVEPSAVAAEATAANAVAALAESGGGRDAG